MARSFYICNICTLNIQKIMKLHPSPPPTLSALSAAPRRRRRGVYGLWLHSNERRWAPLINTLDQVLQFECATSNPTDSPRHFKYFKLRSLFRWVGGREEGEGEERNGERGRIGREKQGTTGRGGGEGGISIIVCFK